jgi:hypothetical protein
VWEILSIPKDMAKPESGMNSQRCHLAGMGNSVIIYRKERKLSGAILSLAWLLKDAEGEILVYQMLLRPLPHVNC